MRRFMRGLLLKTVRLSKAMLVQATAQSFAKGLVFVILLLLVAVCG